MYFIGYFVAQESDVGTGWVLGLRGLSRASQDFSIAMGRNLIGDANQQLNLRHILNFDV